MKYKNKTIRFEKRAKKITTTTWEHGRYFDLWSIIHTLTGVILGTLATILNINFFTALFITAVLMILWEVLEVVFEMAEDIQNVITDVVVGLSGFFLINLLFVIWPSLLNYLPLILIALLIIYISLNYNGWKTIFNKKKV